VVSNHIRRRGRSTNPSTAPCHTGHCDTRYLVATKMQSRFLLLVKVFATTLNFMGRPRTPPAKAKSMYVRFRVTQSERAELLRRVKAAKAKNESVWIRKRLLGED
jgi:hypothetical protein